MSETKNVLRVENVTMQFGGVVAVDDLSMEVNEGEIVALIGPNGAGKTTAFNVITGVYAPTNGQVLFDGKKVVENHPRGKMRRQYKGKHLGDYKSVLEPTPDKLTRMGMARTFQNIRLWKSMTVFDNVAFAMRVIGAKENTIKKRVPFVLDIVGLTDKMNCYPTELSGGEQQRVALARALANNADLIIADEPTGNVDPRMSLEIVDLLMRLNSEGTTVIMVTHEHNLVRMYDKRVILLENGTVAADGKMKNSAHREIKMKGSLGRPADGFATKYLDDEDGEAGKPGKLSEKAAEIANETAADDAYRQALESFGKEKAEYGSEYDTSYSSAAADYSIYLEDGEGDESNEK